MSDGADQREPDQLDGVPPPEQRDWVIGHEAARTALAERLTAERMPSAVLLHGPQGIGKATLAFAMARDLLSGTGDEDPHRVAEQVAAGSHPNLYVLRKQPKDGKGFYTVIRVDDIRELRERMRKTRGRTGYRVAIIDSIDDCNANSANALLKTLEEPPAETLFLLISHRPGQLLPTIKSRCHTVALRPVTDDAVREVLTRTAPGVDSVLLETAVALAHGRPRRGFEALAMSNDGALSALKGWLRDPASHPPVAHLSLADALAADPASAEASFGRDVIIEWMAEEARSAALAGTGAYARLASANELWDKAHALFTDADDLNLDARQTLVIIFDAIRKHARRTSQTEPQ
ncbi:MAG: polymerase subunit delta [Hyphomicrobiales bacterium]|nr:polymerase subunit delta [Hyphomicrobiales bacterium]